MLIFNFKSKFVLRISGFPKLNFIRKFFWKLANKKIYKVICPTEGTYKDLLEKKIFSAEKMCVIYDPAISSSNITVVHEVFTITVPLSKSD